MILILLVIMTQPVQYGLAVEMELSTVNIGSSTTGRIVQGWPSTNKPFTWRRHRRPDLNKLTGDINMLDPDAENQAFLSWTSPLLE